MPPSWLALLSPLPDDAVPERRPVAPDELMASGQASAIAGWENLSLHLSAGVAGLRHVLVTLDAGGTLLSAGDHVLFQRQEPRGGTLVTVYDHESVGGRYEADGSFHGTRWRSTAEQRGEDDDAVETSATPSTPSAGDVEALNRLVAEVLRRAPVRNP